MKQSYDKEQHAIAKAEERAMICIGWDGRYLSNKVRRDKILFYGPATDEMLALIRATFSQLCEMEGREQAAKGAVTP